MSSSTASGTDVYYDPYDKEIDTDPYPVFRRLRDEAPLYYNEVHDFYALSRFDDVEACEKDWRTYISGKGSVLEGRVAIEEVLARFPTWEVDWNHAVQAHTSTVRGWEKLPVVTPTCRPAGADRLRQL